MGSAWQALVVECPRGAILNCACEGLGGERMGSGLGLFYPSRPGRRKKKRKAETRRSEVTKPWLWNAPGTWSKNARVGMP
eukprot:1338217-Pyramimonas_sp.AAC.1